MIYIIGDTHGSFNNFKSLIESEEITSKDTIIVAGDFGFYFFDSIKEIYKRYTLTAMSKAKICFVDGNHENFVLLSKLSKVEMFGSVVGLDEDSGIIHLLRGHKYEIDMKTFFVFGGGYSIDKERRQKSDVFLYGYNTWWKEEMPSEEEYKFGIETLEKSNWEVDFIITHTTPKSIFEMIHDEVYIEQDFALENYLEEIKERAKFKKWIFGHLHNDFSSFGKFYGLYDMSYMKIGSEFDTILHESKYYKKIY